METFLRFICFFTGLNLEYKYTKRRGKFWFNSAPQAAVSLHTMYSLQHVHTELDQICNVIGVEIVPHYRWKLA